MDPDTMSRIEAAVKELASREYPRVWIGEAGMTPFEYLLMEERNVEDRREAWEELSAEARQELFDKMPEDLRKRVPEEMFQDPPAKWDELPEWLRGEIRGPLEVEPGEVVGIEGREGGIQIPKIGYEYLGGLWVIENMCDELDESTEAELHREVLYIYAAKRGEVPIITDSQERYEADLPPEIRRVPLEELTPEDAADALELVEFYVLDTMGPYLIEDSERARAALEKRLKA